MADGAAAAGFPVQMVAIEGRGRGLFATRDIAAGETVLQEAPNMLIAAPEYLPVVCAQCLRGLAGHPGTWLLSLASSSNPSLISSHDGMTYSLCPFPFPPTHTLDHLLYGCTIPRASLRVPCLKTCLPASLSPCLPVSLPVVPAVTYLRYCSV